MKEEKKYTLSELAKMFKFPSSGIVEFEGAWWEPSEISSIGSELCVAWLPISQRVDTLSTGDFTGSSIPYVILKKANVPPRPTPEQLAAITPDGLVVVLGDMPSKTAVPYVGLDHKSNIIKILYNSTFRNDMVCDGWRWPVTLKSKPVSDTVQYFQYIENPKLVCKVVNGRIAEAFGWRAFIGTSFASCVDKWKAITLKKYEEAQADALKITPVSVKDGGDITVHCGTCVHQYDGGIQIKNSCDGCGIDYKNWEYNDPSGGYQKPKSNNKSDDESWMDALSYVLAIEQLQRRVDALSKEIKDMQSRGAK